MAIESALFVGWNRAISGKEADALELFGSALAWFGKLQSQGQIASFETTLLEAHGGDLNGFILIKGEVAKLQAVKQMEEWKDLIAKSTWTMQNFGVNHAVVGDGVTKELARFQKLVTR